jgi:diadenosine tetraphosphatase ApaH/serine/threonine PP2A family protein phosphatase
MHFQVTVLGNHDQGAMFDPPGFCPSAEQAIFWTRDQLESGGGPRSLRDQRWEFLAGRPRTHRDELGLFVHGSARNPLNEYVFPEDVYNRQKMERIFALVERHCFQGHTHHPGVFTQEPGEEHFRFTAPDESDYTHTLDHRKTLINVGSVGQPRDGDWRACYVLLDGARIQFRRVPYDVDETVRKIHAVPELDRRLGDRLRRGE